MHDLFFFPTFFYLRRILVGVFSELKIPKSNDHLLKNRKSGSPLAQSEISFNTLAGA
jgi:hypothetical protein